MKVIITGATSFIGRNLARRAIEKGWETLLVVRPGHDLCGFPADVRVIPLCMEDYGQLGKLSGPSDCFVHLAWSGTRGALRMDKTLQEKNLKYSLFWPAPKLNMVPTRIRLLRKLDVGQIPSTENISSHCMSER